ncbi:MAG: outer membrane receptor protein involved in Fe transport [Gammaproteobacteria bacterium]|jgi:outer membrane receptor protein involved in Fe transport
MLLNTYLKFRHTSIHTAFVAVISTLLLATPTILPAQVLEEIVVTAQRREQSLQDVPIAIDVVSAKTLQREGFNTLEEMTAFTPGVFVNEGGDQGSDTFIRGFGTVGRNWANDSAIPLFLDNVNLGQGSMGAIAFMDTQRVEILKGPQPIHFGLNATGGALSIVSTRPTDTWDGYVNAETGMAGDWSQYKRMGNHELEAAIGGPITDTLSFRVAGQYSTRDGHIRDAVTGFPMGYRNFFGGRLSFAWQPTDKLSVYSKLELASQAWQGTDRVCRRAGEYPNRFERRGSLSAPNLGAVESDPTAVWIDYDEGGTGFATPHIPVDDCGVGGAYTGQTTSYEQPTFGIRTRDTDSGFMDIRAASAGYLNTLAGGGINVKNNATRFGMDPVTLAPLPGDDFLGYRGNGTGVAHGNGYQDGQRQSPMNVQLELNYEFDNGINVAWTNNYMDSLYTDASVGRNTPYVENIRSRIEDYEQKSSELRISSFGGGAIEWMVGAFIQKEKLNFTTVDYRSEIRFGNRMNDNYQNATWSSYFGNVTYNFYEDQLSLDVGVRYSKAKKDPTLRSYNSAWIFDVTPCRGDGAGNTDENFRGDTNDWGGIPVQDIDSLGTECVAGVEPEARRIAQEDALFLTNSLQNRSVNTDNLWFVPRGGERDTPSTWRGPYTAAVGMTPFSLGQRAGEQWDNLNDLVIDPAADVSKGLTSWDNWDPQIVLRYRPTDQLSTYFKYATAFKAGGYDLGFGGSQPDITDSPPGGIEELLIDPESSKTYELGASGSFLDGRGRFQSTLFRVDFDDLIATTVTSVGTDDQGTQVINIGKQRAQGFELSAGFAWSEQLNMSVNLSYLDSAFTYFPNANCTEHEVRTAAESGCAFFDDDGNSLPIGTDPDDIDVAVIDRAGQTAAFAPKFGITYGLDYWVPFKGLKIDTGALVTYQSSYFSDFREFDKSNIQRGAADLNLHIGIGEMNDKWRVGLALRNLLEPRNTFRPELTSDIAELGGENLRTNQVKSIALTFNYKFQ